MHEELTASDWDIVKRLLPTDWETSARQCGALRRTRNVDSAETLLRLILLHVAGGLSLRQTVVRAEAFGWATLSDVALLKRLRASANWLESLCWGLWSTWDWPEGMAAQGRRWRIVDATTAQEPGATGIDWRVHYVVSLPSLACDFVSVTGVRGGETLCRIPVRPGDVLLADRGYSHRAGVAWVLSQKGDAIVRHQGANFPLLDRQGKDFDLLSALRGLHKHQPGTWKVQFESDGQTWAVWLHAVRKSAAAAKQAKEELRKVQEVPARVEAELQDYLDDLEKKDVVEFIGRKFNLDAPTAEETYKVVLQTLSEDGTVGADALQDLLEQTKKETGVTREISVGDIVDYRMLREVAKESRP